MILRQKEKQGGGPCLTALAAFASSDSSMVASSEAEGTISCGGSTVVAILFFIIFSREKKIELSGTGGGYVIHVI